MNFADFSFWWILLLSFGAFLGIRFLSQYLKFWSPSLDRVGLLVISLIIFWNAAQYSFTIFILGMVFNYFMTQWMLSFEEQGARTVATITIVIDVLILIYFKYFDFLIYDILNLHKDVEITLSLLPNSEQIPPGISFYTFQQIAYVIDSYRMRKEHSNIGLLNYMSFVSFFPQVVAGPIERRSDLLPQIRNFHLRLTFKDFEFGMRWIVLGLFLKLVLADNISSYINLSNSVNA